jgi:hypothetical protein
MRHETARWTLFVPSIPRGGVVSKKHSVWGAAGARTTLPSVGGPAESSPGLCIWGGSGGCCRLRNRQAGRFACGQGNGNKSLRGVVAESHARAAALAGAALRGGPGRPRGCATPHVNAVRRILAPRAGSSRRAAPRGSQSAGARAPAPLCPPVEVSRGPRRGSEGSRHGWCGRASVGGEARPHNGVRASFAHHYVPRAGRRACAPRQWQ